VLPAPRSVHPSAEDVQAQAVLALTPGRKLELAAQLRELAWELKALGIRSQHPGMPEAEVQERVREIFLYART
jgi:hypothetical protein